MDRKLLVRSFFGVFVFIVLFDILYHGVLLSAHYEATAYLWRTHEQMQKLYVWVVVSQLGLAFMSAWIFQYGYKGQGGSEGVRFGLFLGTLLAFLQFAWYPYLPVYFKLVMLWAFGSLIQGIGIGTVLGYIAQKNANSGSKAAASSSAPASQAQKKVSSKKAKGRVKTTAKKSARSKKK